jgi:hypothetical protein
MAWKMKFRFVIYAVANGTPGNTADSNIMTVGYDPGATDNTDNDSDILSLNQAVSSCLAFLRRYDSIGRDVRGEVYGQPFGTDAAQAVIGLNGDVAGVGGGYPDVRDEDLYARLDVVPRYLKQRIAIANRPGSVGVRGLTAPPDTESEP